LNRANLSISSKIPGGSNTAQDINSILKGEHGGLSGAAHGHGTQSTLATMFLAEMAERLPVLEHIPGLGPMIVVGRMVAAHLKPGNMAKVDRLVTQAMLHPEITQQLLRPVLSPQEAGTIGQRLVMMLGASAATAEGEPTHKAPTGVAAQTYRLPSFLPSPVPPRGNFRTPMLTPNLLGVR
jgi:hypothetical protein